MEKSVVWRADQYEDYYNCKSDEDRTRVFNLHGIPEDLKPRYEKITGTPESLDIKLSEEECELV